MLNVVKIAAAARKARGSKTMTNQVADHTPFVAIGHSPFLQRVVDDLPCKRLPILDFLFGFRA